jgi:ATP-dependent RNA helicase DOB1
MKIDDEELVKLIEKKKKMEDSKKELERSSNSSKLKDNLAAYESLLKHEKSISMLKSQIEDCNKMVLTDDLKSMKRVLRRLEFIDKTEIVQMKGRVACDLSACDEIIVRMPIVYLIHLGHRINVQWYVQ